MNWQSSFSRIFVLSLLFSMGACIGVYSIRQNQMPSISIDAGHTRPEDTLDKTSSLLTSLGYDIERAWTVDGIAYGNFVKECENENRKEECIKIAKDHMSRDIQVYHSDNSLSEHFYKEITDDEMLSVSFLIKETNGLVTIKLQFSDNKPDQGLSQTALDEHSKVIAFLRRSYGDANVKIQQHN